MKILPSLTVAVALAITGIFALKVRSAEELAQPRSSPSTNQDRLSTADSLGLLAQNDPKKSEKAQASQPKQSGEEKTPESDKPKSISSSAEATLKQARERLKGYRSIQANIVEKVVIGERRFKATGRYLQGTDLKLRLEFEIQIGTSRGSLLEVCDGEVLTSRQMIALQQVGLRRKKKSDADTKDGKKAATEKGSKEQKNQKGSNSNENVRITRRNVREILNAALDADALPQNLLVAELGLGGLPGLLASLQRTMVFDKQTEEVVGEKKFTIIEGTWNQKYRDRWNNSQNGEDGLLPNYLPDRVRIYFNRENLFPLRILYLKKAPGRKIFRPMVTVDLKDVVVNASIDASEFNYEPPDSSYVTDITNQYIQQLIRSQPKPVEQESPRDGTSDKQQTPSNSGTKQ